MSEDVDKKTLTYSLFIQDGGQESEEDCSAQQIQQAHTNQTMPVIQITNHDFNNASVTAWFWSIQHVQSMYHIA